MVHLRLTAKSISRINQPKLNTNNAHSTGHAFTTSWLTHVYKWWLYVCTGTPNANSKIYLINQPKLNTNDAHSTGASPHPDLRMYTNGGYMRVQVHLMLTAQKIVSSINQTILSATDAPSTGHVCAYLPKHPCSTKRIQMVAMFGHTQALTTKALTSQHTVSHKRLAKL